MAPDYLSPNFLNKEKIQECVREFQKLGFPQCFAGVRVPEFGKLSELRARCWGFETSSKKKHT